MKSSLILFLACGAGAFGQTEKPKPDLVVASSKGFYTYAKTEVLKAAEKMPADSYSFRPTDDVRTFAEVLGHIADATYGICGGAIGEKAPSISVEKTKKTKPEVISALKEAFTYCDGVWAGMTSDKMLETATMFGGPKTRVSILDFNTGHTYEHYGNLSTYLRMKKIIPPSSEEPH
jgi:uncharacterized damage-inducible protein DinB